MGEGTPRDESVLFEAALAAVIAAPEVARQLGAAVQEDRLRTYLHGLQEDVSGAAAVERQRWLRAVDEAEEVRQDRTWPRRKRVGHTWLRYLEWVFLGAALVFAVIAVVMFAQGLGGETAQAGVGFLIFVALLLLVAAGISLADRRWARGHALARRERGARDSRQAYYEALVQQLLGAARAEINRNTSGSRYDFTLRVRDSPGLAGIYSERYRIQRASDSYLDGLFAHLPGVTVGVAGPRGAGKTSLLSRYCRGEIYVPRDGRGISMLLNAPVEYEPREFVLYLLTILCRSYIRYRELRGESARQSVASRLRSARSAAEEADAPDPLTLAHLYLREARYLQTVTTATSASVSAYSGIFGFSRSRESSAAEVPRSYPELVGAFRSFLKVVALEVRGDGGRVFIGIDELDKISDAGQAQRFINEMKTVLGVPNCYYLITLSDDALASYEMRGLSVRDAFDSAFDEIIHIGYMRLRDSRDLLSRRVIGLPDPFVCLCHCLSGGLARDLIRAARHAVAAARDQAEASRHIVAVCQRLVAEDLGGRLHAAGVALADHRPRPADSEFLHAAQRIADGRHSGLRGGLADLCRRRGIPGEAVIDGKSPADALFAYLWFLLTVLEMFGEGLSRERIDAGSDEGAGECVFDQMCRARQELGTDPGQAILTVKAVRDAWPLPA